MTVVWVGLADVVPAPTWHRHALCRGQVELFYASDVFSQRVAVAVCGRCGVRQKCLAEALAEESGERFGVRAGLRPDERARLTARSYDR